MLTCEAQQLAQQQAQWKVEGCHQFAAEALARFVVLCQSRTQLMHVPTTQKVSLKQWNMYKHLHRHITAVLTTNSHGAPAVV